MSILFISHSGQDNEPAIKVRNWLREHGWGQVFLDLDPQQGLAPGQRWQLELKQAGERCAGVLVLISPNWVTSDWCRTEFLVADQLGKKIFPLFVAPTPFANVPVGLRAKFHIADISTPEKEAEGFERLSIGLKRAGLDPKSFEWPPPNEPHRAIYRGLQSLDEQDAAIFFGRDALITKGLDALRRMRDGAPERFLVILSASGAGKSSFLKAGLIARLKRDQENFLVLPVIRPERAALSGDRGLAASLACDPTTLNRSQDVVEALAKLRAQVTERFKRLAESAHESHTSGPPTIVIAIDQAEELFGAENAEAARVLEFLADAVRLDADTIVAVTIRSDSFEKLQSEPRLSNIPILPFSLAPLPHGAFKEAIEGPARLAAPPLAVEPALSDRLLQDLAADDALPLLAFTLERLSSRHRDGGKLTLAEYVDALGGLKGAIVSAVEAAFSEALLDPALPHSRLEIEKLARAAFIPALVQLDGADSEPRRRVERLNKLPQSTHGLVRHLIDQRLLVSDRSAIDGDETDMVEVAHEAILRQWPTLRGWIAEERDALRALDAARMAAMEWHKHAVQEDSARGQSWLAHRGSRLEEAEALIARPDFAGALGPPDLEYLAACRASETSQRTREQRQLERTRRLQRNIGILIVIATFILVIGGAGILRLLAETGAQVSVMLAAQAAKEAEAGNYDRAARYALKGLTAAEWPLMGSYGSRSEVELLGAESASRAVAVLLGHERHILSVAVSPDGKRILTASRDGTARIWDAKTARQISILHVPGSAVYDAAFSPDGRRIVTASDDRTARVWDANTAREIAVMRGHEDAVVSVAFSPDGKRLVTGSWDNTARIWDANSGHETAVLRGHEEGVNSAAFTPDGGRVVTASDDKTSRIWDVGTARELVVLRGHEAVVNGATFSPDGRRVATASDDKTARIWDSISGNVISVLHGHESAVNSVAYSRDGTRVVTASRDNTARIWDARTGRELFALRGHEDSVNGAAFGPDGKRIVTASDDNTARIWNADAGFGSTVLRGHEDKINSVAVSFDGGRVVTASNDKTAHIWDLNTGSEIAVLTGHKALVETVAFSPDGTRIVTASDDRTARIWDVNTAHVIGVLQGHQEAVDSAAFSPDGKRIVTASADRTARIWDASTGRELTILRGHGDAVESATFSPDGRQVVTASEDRTARIWDVNTARVVAVLRGHEDAVYSAAFSPDGRRIVVASRDRTARIWDARIAREIVALRGHEDVVLNAAFSPDGKRVVTASKDGTARIWDAGTGHEIAVLRGHEGSVYNAAFTPDGTRIVTASDDGTARIWNVSATVSTSRDVLIRRTCEAALANGLSKFSAKELRAAPGLDSNLDADACNPAGLGARLWKLFWVGVSE